MIFYCVNDGAVMKAWEKDQMGDDDQGDEPFFKFLADTRAEFTKGLDLVLDHPGPMGVLGNPRCKRFAMYLDDGVIKVFETSEKPDDPAGDDFPESSCVDNMLEQISKVL